MKKGSDNARESAVMDLINTLINENIELIIFEPNELKEYDLNYVDDFDEFVERADLIIANRLSDDLAPYENKVFTRDIFNKD